MPCAGKARASPRCLVWSTARQFKVADRTAAEKLTNTRLFIDRSALPPAEDDEFYVTDLIGLLAVGADGRDLGVVAIVHDYGAGASLEIRQAGGAPLIVPFTMACVPTVDIAGGKVVVVPAGRNRGRRRRRRHDLARLRPDAVSGACSRVRSASRWPAGPGKRPLVVGRDEYPRLRDRSAPDRGRHAVRRRRGHGAAAGYRRCGGRHGG